MKKKEGERQRERERENALLDIVGASAFHIEQIS
jgi:hypothetical protein